MIKVSFAAKRPPGAYALAIPVRSEDMLHDRLAGLDEAARTLAARSAEAQRFEREAGAIAETFVDDGDVARRLLLVGYGARQDEVAIHERVGGALTARLLTSGETRLVIDCRRPRRAARRRGSPSARRRAAGATTSTAPSSAQAEADARGSRSSSAPPRAPRRNGRTRRRCSRASP